MLARSDTKIGVHFASALPTRPSTLWAALGIAAVLAMGTMPARAAEQDSRAPRAAFTLGGLEASQSGEIEVDFLASSNPHVALSWAMAEDESGANATLFIIQQASTPDFSEPRTIYEGQDQASFQPGLAEGDHFYRVRAVTPEGETGPWSRPLHVQIEYQSMALAVSLFVAGGVVFLATLVLVIAGTLKDRQEARDEETAK